MGCIQRLMQRWSMLLVVAVVLTGCGGNSGLVVHKYDGVWERLPDFAELAPVSRSVVPDVGIHELGEQDFGLVIKGKLTLPETGIYQFSLSSDDGSKLYLNGVLVADNDGIHGLTTATSDSITMAAGEHELRVEYFQRSGGLSLALNYRLNNNDLAPVTSDMLTHENQHLEPDSGGDSGGGDSGGSTLSSDKQEYTEGESVSITWHEGSGSELDWIGIFAAGTLNNSCANTDSYVDWEYTNGSSGSEIFRDLAVGEYQAQLFSDDSYCHIGDPITFRIVSAGGGDGGNPDATLTLPKELFQQGEAIQVSYRGGTGSDTDWIGIFRAGTLNDSCDSTDAYITWQYTDGASGIRTFTGLGAGNYQAQLFADDGYCHVGSPVSFEVESGGDTGGGDGGVKVAFIGDTGTGSNFQSVLDLIRQEGAELTIVAGDTSYSSSRDDDWDAMVRNTLGNSDPALVAAGNHDYGDSDFSDVRAYGEARLRNAAQVSCSGDYAEKMSCRYKNLYIVLSAVGSGGSRSDHESYIANRLENAPAGAWRICTWHKNQRDMQAGGKSDEVGWTAYETCRRKGAIIATGHEHSYSRTHLLSDMSEQTVASTSSTLTLTEGRTFAFVSGLGGIGIRDQERNGDWWASIYTSTQGARYGAMFGTFYDDRAEFYFKNTRGQIIDQFTVMKGY